MSGQYLTGGLYTHSYVFIRIPRTGSTSICEALGNYPDHKTAEMWREKVSNYDELFKFTIVRNPLDRFISMISYFDVPFEKFQEDRRFIPQVNYIRNGNLDYIGRFENLDKSWEAISERLGLPLIKLNHLKKTENRQKLTPNQVQVVYRYYKEDFKTFNY